MKQAISEDLISFSTMMMLAHDRGEIISLASQLNNIIEKAMEFENSNQISINKKETSSTTIKFTKQEVDQMSKTFKKEFIANGCVSHIIARPSGKKGKYYEIRYRRNGYNISVSNKDLKKAKELFVLITRRQSKANSNSALLRRNGWNTKNQNLPIFTLTNSMKDG